MILLLCFVELDQLNFGDVTHHQCASRGPNLIINKDSEFTNYKGRTQHKVLPFHHCHLTLHQVLSFHSKTFVLCLLKGFLSLCAPPPSPNGACNSQKRYLEERSHESPLVTLTVFWASHYGKVHTVTWDTVCVHYLHFTVFRVQNSFLHPHNSLWTPVSFWNVEVSQATFGSLRRAVTTQHKL